MSNPALADIRRAPRPAAPGGKTSLDEDVSLSAVDRRRAELWTISVILVMSVTAGIALLSVGRDLLPESLQMDELAGWIVTVLAGGIALAFLVYVWEKERNLRRLTHLLVEERVHSTALAHRVSEMARLSEVGRAVNSALDRGDVLNTILRSALELLGGTQGAVLLAQDDTTLLPAAHQGSPAGADGAAITIGEGPEGRVAAFRKPTLVDHSSETPGAKGSTMVVPLLRNDELLGVLRVTSEDTRRRFGPGDLQALGFFAEHAAIAIANERLIGAERETVARLKELDRLKNDFVATVSHELRTPLTAIIGAAKTVARKGPAMDAEHHETFMNMIQRQADRLLRLVQDVLTASRMESTSPRLEREPIQLRGLVEDLIEDFTHTGLGSGRRILLHTDPERPRTWGDPGAVEQILSNLIENALKYSSSDVHVTVTESPIETEIEIADHGEGMSPEQMATIFERFRQADPSAPRSAGGFGLGLFIVKSLVEAQNGQIEVDSERGVGTCFKLRFPRRATDLETT